MLPGRRLEREWENAKKAFTSRTTKKNSRRMRNQGKQTETKMGTLNTKRATVIQNAVYHTFVPSLSTFDSEKVLD
jgi:hypothetical protein